MNAHTADSAGHGGQGATGAAGSSGSAAGLARGAVHAPAGFRATGVTAGLKASGKSDLALIVNEGPMRSAAAVFTTNRVFAAPVKWSRQVLQGGEVDAVILNSGGANACTGEAGFADSAATAEHVADLVGSQAERIAVCSTGLIGERLNMPVLLAGADAAATVLNGSSGGDGDIADGSGGTGGTDDGAAGGWLQAATAIMTTDSVAKTATGTAQGITVSGMAKGAGMLAPSLATMLVVLATDAQATPSELDAALRHATRVTFDRLDSDGAMSTNDTVLLMASGSSGVYPSQQVLTDAVTAVCADLARQLMADAEGATKDITIEVVGAASEDDAVEVGRAIARNNLVKTAFFGSDPNWGRIVAAIGTTDARFDPDRLDVAMNDVWICIGCAPGADRSTVDLSGREIHVIVDLHAGEETATILTNDLSHGYVHENSAYST